MTRVREVTERLSERIRAGDWPVGARIPTEPQLVEAFGVGRNTVREAVRALVHAGVLERRQGSGTYVVSTDELAGAVARKIGAVEVAHTVEVRRAFEVEGACGTQEGASDAEKQRGGGQEPAASPRRAARLGRRWDGRGVSAA